MIALLLDLSGKLTFATLAIWVVLRVIAGMEMLLRSSVPNHHPLSAQRLGLAQGLAENSVIISEAHYKAKKKEFGFLQKLAKSWWPLLAWAAMSQFVILFGARGIAEQLSVPFWLGLALALCAFGSLGFYRRRALSDHLKESVLPEGEELEWDAESIVAGMRLRVRFDDEGKRLKLSRPERNAISKDGAMSFSYRGLACNPASVHRHGEGLIVSDFHMWGAPGGSATKEDWVSKVKLRDAMQSALNAYVVANEMQLPAVALLEYPGAAILVNPLAEHIEHLEAVGERLRSRKRIEAIPVRDVCLSAAQEFPSKFSEERLAELLAGQKWIGDDEMKL